MRLTSTAIPDGATIALQYAEPNAGGGNVPPDLHWTDAPAGTQSFAITCYDPDAPTGSGWWHWVVVDIPAAVTSLAENAALPEGAREWVNDYGYVGYGGPCPPPGPAHRYVFTVYALGVATLPVADDAPSAPTRFAVRANALDEASFTGLFALPEPA